MVDLNEYGLTIGIEADRVEGWFKPVLSRGRGAVFVDTGFLRGLFTSSGEDQYSSQATAHFDGAAATNFYTTDLVLAEAVRQIAKEKGLSGNKRKKWFRECSQLVVSPSVDIFVCAPPRKYVMRSRKILQNTGLVQTGVDLCDVLTGVVLDYACHRRIFGFDSDLAKFGAQLEPSTNT
jgi:predicted nucleic acid-binding protein